MLKQIRNGENDISKLRNCRIFAKLKEIIM